MCHLQVEIRCHVSITTLSATFIALQLCISLLCIHLTIIFFSLSGLQLKWSLLLPLHHLCPSLSCSYSPSYIHRLLWFVQPPSPLPPLLHECIYIPSSASISHTCCGPFHLFHHLISPFLFVIIWLVINVSHWAVKGNSSCQHRHLFSVEVSREN